MDENTWYKCIYRRKTWKKIKSETSTKIQWNWKTYINQTYVLATYRCTAKVCRNLQCIAPRQWPSATGNKQVPSMKWCAPTAVRVQPWFHRLYKTVAPRCPEPLTAALGCSLQAVYMLYASIAAVVVRPLCPEIHCWLQAICFFPQLLLAVGAGRYANTARIGCCQPQ